MGDTYSRCYHWRGEDNNETQGKGTNYLLAPSNKVRKTAAGFCCSLPLSLLLAAIYGHDILTPLMTSQDQNGEAALLGRRWPGSWARENPNWSQSASFEERFWDKREDFAVWKIVIKPYVLCPLWSFIRKVWECATGDVHSHETPFHFKTSWEGWT